MDASAYFGMDGRLLAQRRARREDDLTENMHVGLKYTAHDDESRTCMDTRTDNRYLFITGKSSSFRPQYATLPPRSYSKNLEGCDLNV